AVDKTNSWKKPWAWLRFLLLSVGMLALGTNVGFGGILIVLFSVVIGSVIMLCLFIQRIANVRSNLIVSLVLTAILVVITPFTPVFGNMFAHITSLGINFGEPVERPGEPVLVEGQEGFEEQEEAAEITKEQVQNLVFSSREVYAQEMKKDFYDSPLTQQLFGMGFAGNYPEPLPGKTPKMIEMDFHDWFYSFGWLGFLYLMA